MRLISSPPALSEMIALAAARELTLSRLARAVGAAPSAAQRALEILVADGVVERSGERGPRYRLAAGGLTDVVLDLALYAVTLERAAGVAGRASPALELVMLDDGVLRLVFTSTADSPDSSRAAAFFERLAARHGLELRYLEHDDARRLALAQPEVRERMLRARALHGEVDRSFPDRSLHGMAAGLRLGRPHPSLRLPSRRLLRRVASQHGLASMQLFGSAVRTDFRPDSDVDVLVAFRPGVRPTLGSLIDLERELERSMDRDVHLVDEAALRPPARSRIREEAVTLP